MYFPLFTDPIFLKELDKLDGIRLIVELISKESIEIRIQTLTAIYLLKKYIKGKDNTLRQQILCQTELCLQSHDRRLRNLAELVLKEYGLRK